MSDTSTRPPPRRAQISLRTPPYLRSTEPLLVSFSFSCTARPHLTTSPRPVPTRSCQGVRGHGGRHRHGPRPRRRCRLEGTPRDPRNSNPDAHSRARGTPRASPRLRRKNIRTDRRVLCHKTFEPEADPTPAPPPAELALADQARCGSVLRQGQVNGFWRARRATTRRHALGECNADRASTVVSLITRARRSTTRAFGFYGCARRRGLSLIPL